MLRFRNRLLLFQTGNWLTLVILGLPTEKLSVRTFILPGTSTYRARVRRTFCIPTSRRPCIKEVYKAIALV